MSVIKAATHTFNESENTKISISGASGLDLTFTANNIDALKLYSNGTGVFEGSLKVNNNLNVNNKIVMSNDQMYIVLSNGNMSLGPDTIKNEDPGYSTLTIGSNTTRGAINFVVPNTNYNSDRTSQLFMDVNGGIDQLTLYKFYNNAVTTGPTSTILNGKGLSIDVFSDGQFLNTTGERGRVTFGGIGAYSSLQVGGSTSYAYGHYGITSEASSSGNTYTENAAGIKGSYTRFGSGNTKFASGGEFSITDSGTGTTDQVHGVYSSVGLSSNTGNTYLYYGIYDQPSLLPKYQNKYGIYLSRERKNYFSGNVGIGIENPTSNLHVIGTANIVGDIRDSKGDVRDLPVNNQTSPYILTLTDAGKTVAITTGNVFVPNAIFSAGQAISVYNNSAASITVTQNTSVTMYLAGTATTGNRTLAQRGVATVLCVAANTFVISGAGLT